MYDSAGPQPASISSLSNRYLPRHLKDSAASEATVASANMHSPGADQLEPNGENSHKGTQLLGTVTRPECGLAKKRGW